MNAITHQQCAHPACSCKVPNDEAYCSEHCRKRMESPLSNQVEGCQCGHAECAAAREEAEKMERPRAVQSKAVQREPR
jgi:hypothetical protein